jgi:hypothetical protein
MDVQGFAGFNSFGVDSLHKMRYLNHITKDLFALALYLVLASASAAQTTP